MHWASLYCRRFWQGLAPDKDGWMNTRKEHGGSDVQWLARMQLTDWVSTLYFLNLFADMYVRNGLLKYHRTNACDNGSKDTDKFFPYISLKGFGREHWTTRDHFGLIFWTFAKKVLLLQAALPADLLSTCRVDNITTLRTGKEEVWNEIYFQRVQRCLANSLSVCCCKSKKDQATFQENID